MISNHKNGIEGYTTPQHKGSVFKLVECVFVDEASPNLVLSAKYYTLQHPIDEAYHIYDLNFRYHLAAYKRRFIDVVGITEEETLKDFK